MCSRGSVSGGFCGLGGAWFCVWSIGTTTTCGCNGGFCFGGFFCEGSFPFAWSVALLFVVLCIGGSFGTMWSFFCHMVSTDLVLVPAILITAILYHSFSFWLNCQVSFCLESYFALFILL